MNKWKRFNSEIFTAKGFDFAQLRTQYAATDCPVLVDYRAFRFFAPC